MTAHMSQKTTEDIRFSALPATPLKDAAGIISQLLPKQGCIEVQHDQPGKEHAWHTHPTDETLVILEGSVRFYFEGGERICTSGEIIHLPAFKRHGSIALQDGCVYLISMEPHTIEGAKNVDA